ncbi:hypothetical protein [Pseudomonas sp. DR208]|uniref:hypothetical protein n=1 Tax=Pseudomonas sp. DR208 TaxID=2870840 RepID=UPI0021BD3C13|nr:hypothetical protein [Pseudomonas sp. DR208]
MRGRLHRRQLRRREKIRVQDARNKLLLEGSIGADNTYTFQAPAGDYTVLFLGGDNHDATIQSADISR